MAQKRNRKEEVKEPTMTASQFSKIRVINPKYNLWISKVYNMEDLRSQEAWEEEFKKNGIL